MLANPRKVPIIVMSVRPHVNFRFPTGRIVVEFDIGDLHRNVSRNSEFDYNRTKITEIYTQT